MLKKPTIIVVDANGKSLGRIATEVANHLRGKRTVMYAPNIVPNVEVHVVNVTGLRFTGTKLDVKLYHHFSGYPGGIKTTTLRQEFTKDPAGLVRHAVRGMLPKNRLSAQFLRHLKVYRTNPDSK
jgi:large subunit ribosomal protein L13